MQFTYGHGDRPLPGYTIMRAVGRGAFGEVYFAVSDGGREVALKRLVDNAEIELRGVRRCINIKNPHLVSVFDILTDLAGAACTLWIARYVNVAAAGERGLWTRFAAGLALCAAAGLLASLVSYP